MKIVRITLGYCPICNKRTIFVANDYWYRDHYHCLWCKSIPRQRAIMKAMEHFFPNYPDLKIHESSPSGSPFFRMRKCSNYTYSYFYIDKAIGADLNDKCTNQNLEKLTFEDETFDIFITQDVMEHVIAPDKAYKEIARVLKVGGAHIFTVPVNFLYKTKPRIKIEKGKLINTLPPIYHGNPIDAKGALVTYDWGNDICEYIEKHSGMKTEIIEFMNSEENYRNGLEAEYLYVFISRKDNNGNKMSNSSAI